jgi:hypothetical protein
MSLTTRDYDNETNNAIQFAKRTRNKFLINKKKIPLNTSLRDINITSDPTDIIFDLCSQNRITTGLLVINDGRYTNRGSRISINTIYYVQCIVDNFNGTFLLIGVDTLDEIIDILKFMHEVIEYEHNEVFDLDYVRIPQNLLNKWYIPLHLVELNNN